MKLIPIFPENKPAIYSVHYPDEREDEMCRLFDLWSDVEYLETFFNNNKKDLCNGYYRYPSVEAAVEKTLDDAEGLRDYLLELATNVRCDPYSLQTLFQPLNPTETRLLNLQKSKTRYKKSPWLRLYAIRIASDLFVITGGAIKLTKYMEDREHTKAELYKLDLVRNFLDDQGILDKEDFAYLKI